MRDLNIDKDAVKAMTSSRLSKLDKLQFNNAKKKEKTRKGLLRNRNFFSTGKTIKGKPVQRRTLRLFNGFESD